MKRELNWDGEKIRETIAVEEKKHTPKDILNGLDHVRSEINKMENSKEQLRQQMVTNDKHIQEAKAFEKELSEFEARCIEIQKEKIELTIRLIHQECYDKAVESSKKTIAKSPDAYDDRQKKQLPFLDYQKNLATHPKISEKISNRMIRQFLFEEPVFNNPFED